MKRIILKNKTLILTLTICVGVILFSEANYALETDSTPANEPPQASNGNVYLYKNTSVDITLEATDAEGSSLTYIIVSQPSHGTLSGQAPSLSYTPTADYLGEDSFTFKANDGEADSNVATIYINVINDSTLIYDSADLFDQNQERKNEKIVPLFINRQADPWIGEEAPIGTNIDFTQASNGEDTTPPTPPTNLTVTNENMHIVLCSWNAAEDPESGIAFYVFGVGTQPGTADIKPWQVVYRRKAYFYPLKYACQEGATIYVTVRARNNAGSYSEAATSGPLVLTREPLGNAENNVEIAYADYGFDSDRMTLIEGWTQDEIARFERFTSQMLPIIKEVYGSQAHNLTVTFVKDLYYSHSNMYFPQYNELHMNNEWYPQLLTRELIHAFRDNVALDRGQNWEYDPTLSGFEEGFMQAASYECMNKYIQLYPDDPDVAAGQTWTSDLDWDYDFQNVDELRTTDFSTCNSTGIYWRRCEMAAAAMRKIELENPDFYKQFNTAWYTRLNADSSLRSSRGLAIDVIKTIVPQIEGINGEDWLNKQRVFDCQLQPGKKIFVRTEHLPTEQDYLIVQMIYYYETFANGSDWAYWNDTDKKWVYHSLNGSQGEVILYDFANNVVKQDNLTIEPIKGPPHYWSIGKDYKHLINLDNSDAVSADTYIGGLHGLGLYKMEIKFGDLTKTIYRVMGDELVNFRGIWGGIIGANGGTIYIDHEGSEAEEGMPVVNGAFYGERSWAGVLNSGTEHYDTVPGKLHVRYVDGQGNTYIKEVNIDSGSLNGSHIFLFDFTGQTPQPPQAPIANFTANPTQGSAPLTVKFTDKSTGTVTQWQWDFNGDGTIDLEGTDPAVHKNPSHTYDTVGTYAVKLTVTGTAGTNTKEIQNCITVNEPSESPQLDADFTANPTTVEIGESVQFTDTSIGDITSWEWDLGDNTLSTEQNFSHAYNYAGTYTVTLTVAGTGGSDTEEKTITVTEPSVPTGTIKGYVYDKVSNKRLNDILVNLEGAAEDVLSIRATNGKGEYEFTGLSEVSTDKVYKIKVNTAGYTEYTSTDLKFPSSSPYVITHNVELQGAAGTPVVDFNYSQVKGLTVNFTDTSAPQGKTITTYYWDFGDNSESSEKDPSHIYPATGKYTVTHYIFWSGGEAWASMEIELTTSKLVADFIASPNEGPDSLKVKFTDMSSGNPTTWLWDFGDGSTPCTDKNPPLHTYSTPGIYDVRLTVSKTGESEEVTKKVGIAVVDFSADPTQGDAPLTVEFTNDCQGSNITKYAWSFGDGDVEIKGTKADVIHTYNSSGTYTVTLVAIGPVGGSEQIIGVKNISVSVQEPPTPQQTGYGYAEFSANPTKGTYPLPVAFTSLYNGSVTLSYSWNFGDNHATSADNASTLKNPNHTYTQPGCYTVSLTASGGGGSETRTKYIDVNAGSELGTITGKVCNRATGVPIAGATVVLKRPHRFNETVTQTTTDASGNYSFTGIERYSTRGAGSQTYKNWTNYWVEVSAAGYGNYKSSSIMFGEYSLSITHDVTLATSSVTPTTGIIEGFVYDGSKTPPNNKLKDATVVFYTGTTSDPNNPNAKTDTNGYYSVTVQRNVTYKVSAWKDDNYGVYQDTAGIKLESNENSPKRYPNITLPPIIKANFTANPTSVAAGQSVQFTDASTGTITEWKWDFDGDGGYDLTYTDSNKPQAITHTYNNVGTYTVKLTATGPGGTTDTKEKQDYITVTSTSPTNQPPVLAAIGNKTIDEGQLLEFTISATDRDEDTLTYSATNLPSGATFDATIKKFSWTPDYNQAGSYNVTFSVSDGKGGSDTEDITITVNDVIRTYILTINATNGTVTKNPNQPSYNEGTVVTLFATENTGYSFTGWSGDLTDTTNPATITMDKNKSITANFALIPALSVTVSGAQGQPGEKDITVPVSVSDVTGLGFISCQMDLKYDASLLIATGVNVNEAITSDWGNPTYNLKTGEVVISLYGTTALTGAGKLVNIVFEVKSSVSVQDTLLDLTQAKFNDGAISSTLVDGLFKINPLPNHSPVLDTIGDKTIDEGQLLEFTISATDADGDTLTYSATNLPTGATFDATIKKFSWTPDYNQAGTYPAVHFEVSDGKGGSDTEDITITVNDVIQPPTNQPPVLAAIGNKTIDEGQLLEFTISATDADGDSLTYSATNLPSGATFDATIKKFSWTPDYTQAGTYPGVHFEVSDGNGGSDSEDITITVNDVPIPPPPNIVAKFTYEPLTGEAPLTVEFTDESTGTDYNTWNFGDSYSGWDNSIENNRTPTHTYWNPGTYEVMLAVANISNPQGGGPLYTSATITVKSGSNIPATGTLRGYVYDNVYNKPLRGVSVRLLDGGGQCKYSTETDDRGWYEITGIEKNVTYNLSISLGGYKPQAYNISFTNLISYIKRDITLKAAEPPPVAGFTTTPDPPEGEASLEVHFIDSSTGSITKWEWDFNGDGTPDLSGGPQDSGIQTPIWTYTTPGTYSASLTVEGPGGRSAPAVKTIVVRESSTLSGRVYDIDTGNSLAGAQVVLRQMDGSYERTTTTDAEGNYIITRIPKGMWCAIRIFLSGYITPEDKQITFIQNEEYNVGIKVNPVANADFDIVDTYGNKPAKIIGGDTVIFKNKSTGEGILQYLWTVKEYSPPKKIIYQVPKPTKEDVYYTVPTFTTTFKMYTVTLDLIGPGGNVLNSKTKSMDVYKQ